MAFRNHHVKAARRAWKARKRMHDARKTADLAARGLRQRLAPADATAHAMARIKAAILRGLADKPQTHSNQNERPTFPLDI